ncbi:MAG: 3'-5' exonuclease [Cyclobacteriaceae bacterium]|nr:3'-5' exonuclease [Cyclobacteriaceae bacterium]
MNEKDNNYYYFSNFDRAINARTIYIPSNESKCNEDTFDGLSDHENEEYDFPVCQKCGDSEDVCDPGGDYYWCSYCEHYINDEGNYLAVNQSNLDIEKEVILENIINMSDEEYFTCDLCEDINDMRYIEEIYSDLDYSIHSEIDYDNFYGIASQEYNQTNDISINLNEKYNEIYNYIRNIYKPGMIINNSNIIDKKIDDFILDNYNLILVPKFGTQTFQIKFEENIYFTVWREDTNEFAEIINEPYYLFFDIETTGLPVDEKAPLTHFNNWPRLVQLAWQLYDSRGNLIKEKESIIKPHLFSIPKEASDVHGINTNYALENGENLENVLLIFEKQCLKSKYLIAHNINFDSKIIASEFLRILLRNPIKKLEFLCTMESSTDFCKIQGKNGYKWPSLLELHKKLFGYEFDGTHNALVDVKATAKCFWKMRKLKLI